jgi:hypothetical protein
MSLRFFIILLLFLGVKQGFAQTFNYDISFKGIADNREYTREINNEKETIIGSQLGFSVGTNIDKVHALNVGLNYFYEFGSTFLELKPDLLLYYSFTGEKGGVKFGSFPREFLQHFPKALLSDKFMYYNLTVDGILIDHKTETLTLAAFVDWLSRQNELRREQFMVGLTGIYRPNALLIEANAYINHNGRRTTFSETDYIDDYLGGCLTVGYDFSGFLALDKLLVKTGILTSSHRDRLTSKTHVINSSSYSELIAEYKGFGIETFLKFGEKHQFSYGDQYYNNAEHYVRTNLYFVPFKTERVNARFDWSLHFTKGNLDHQQLFILTFNL